MKATPLDAVYAKFRAVVQEAAPASHHELGHFNVFRQDKLRPDQRQHQPPVFHRQDFYKISLTHGHGRLAYADQTLEVGPDTLFLATPRTVYRWEPLGDAPTGYFCIFTAEFLLPTKGGALVQGLPVLKPGAHAVSLVSAAEREALEIIFRKMVQELASDYAYKHDVLRTYVVELLHLVQKLQPPQPPARLPAATRLAAQFAELLEQQFPLEGPASPPRLRTAQNYADQLAVHVVHLNRVLKEATGQTTTQLIGQRVAQEAKALLKYTTGNVAEVADQLGFADAAHFCTFFKRQTGRTPGDFRR